MQIHSKISEANLLIICLQLHQSIQQMIIKNININKLKIQSNNIKIKLNNQITIKYYKRNQYLKRKR